MAEAVLGLPTGHAPDIVRGRESPTAKIVSKSISVARRVRCPQRLSLPHGRGSPTGN